MFTMTSQLSLLILLSLSHFAKSTQCPTSFVGRCGKNWNDANTKCGQCCNYPEDCSIIGEGCFASLDTFICSTTTTSTSTTTTTTTKSPSLPKTTTQSSTHPSTTNKELNHWNEYILPTVSSCGTGKRVSLTFDDGPAEQNGETLEIINKLNSYGIKATFYVSPGAWGEGSVQLAERCDLIAQIAAAGNGIQSHSWGHPDFTTLSNNEIMNELNKVADFLVNCGAQYPTMFRPPYGLLNKEQAEFIASEGYIIGLWNLNSTDWMTPNSKTIVNNIDLNIFNGNSINILMHDRSTYTVINDIIEIFQTNEYEFITQTECFAECDMINEFGICWDGIGQNLDLVNELITEWMT